MRAIFSEFSDQLSVRNPLVLLPVILFFLTSCGKFDRPVPPEALAPRAVSSLEAKGDISGVLLTWRAPESDQRGRELKWIDGYTIYRKEMEKKEDLLNEELEYEVIGTVPDTHLIELEKLREEARAAGKPVRRISVPDERKSFQYTDNTVHPGKFYVYEVIPFNQGDVEGELRKVVRVLFQGDRSEVALLDNSSFEEETFVVEE